MKAIFIAYDQAHHENIITLLEKSNCRGFTAFAEVQGRGSKSGEPHYGTHAWPSLAQAMMAFVECLSSSKSSMPSTSKSRSSD